MKNKELAIKALEAAPGLGILTVFVKTSSSTKANCAIGWLYTAIPEDKRKGHLGVYENVRSFFAVDTIHLGLANDRFCGSKKARRDYMIKLIKEHI